MVQAAGQVQQGSGEGSKVPEKVPGGFGAEPGQVQQDSGEGCGEGVGGFGAEPGQVQQDPEKVPEKVWEALVQSQVRFNRVPEKVWEALVQSQVRFNRVPEKVPEKVWEALVQSQVRFNRIWGHLIHGNPAEVFPALGFAARFRKICKNKTLRLLGILLKLYFFSGWQFCGALFGGVRTLNWMLERKTKSTRKKYHAHIHAYICICTWLYLHIDF